MPAASKWHVVGFTADDIIMAGQDSRLALVCHEAAAKSDLGFEILQAPGDDTHLVFWYISELTAQALDAEGVDWRRFRVSECDAPPTHAFSLLVGDDNG